MPQQCFTKKSSHLTCKGIGSSRRLKGCVQGVQQDSTCCRLCLKKPAWTERRNARWSTARAWSSTSRPCSSRLSSAVAASASTCESAPPADSCQPSPASSRWPSQSSPRSSRSFPVACARSRGYSRRKGESRSTLLSEVVWHSAYFVEVTGCWAALLFLTCQADLNP